LGLEAGTVVASFNTCLVPCLWIPTNANFYQWL